jgi:hypothetical protein
MLEIKQQPIAPGGVMLCYIDLYRYFTVLTDSCPLTTGYKNRHIQEMYPLSEISE